MAARRKKGFKHKQGDELKKTSMRGRRLGKSHVAAFLVGLVLCAGGFLFFSIQFNKPKNTAFASGTLNPSCYSHESNPDSQIRSLYQLVSLSERELEHVDIALMNLLCAQGLNGSENLDITKCLNILDEWAKTIEADTKLRMSTYYKNPSKYGNSVNLFKVVNMILTLKNQFGVDYNLEIMQKTEFINSRDFFIHGCFSGQKEGGCISIPTLCVAVGRRLGYPLKLVLTREHVFFRWDDGKEAFNMEACCPGCDTFPDDYYKKWPSSLKDVDVKMNAFLRSLTPAEELAVFLQTRGHCLYDNGDIAEAQVTYSYSYKLMSDSLDMLAHQHKVFNHEIKKFQKINAGIK